MASHGGTQAPVGSSSEFSELSSTNTATFGLSKHLSIPIFVKIRSLESSHPFKPATSSAKYKNPDLFKVLSQISPCSDLFVKVEVLDGNNNILVPPMQTPYKQFTGNKRVWDAVLKLPINYNQASFETYVKFTLYEIVETKPAFFAEGTLSLFNHENGSLRKGTYKVPIFREEQEFVNYKDHKCTTELERKLIDYENGVVTKEAWLDSLSLPIVERLKHEEKKPDLDAPYHLFVELPNFSLPIVFSDVTYELPNPAVNLLPNDYVDKPQQTNNETAGAMVLTSVELTPKKLYDPDFDLITLHTFNTEEGSVPGGAGVLGQTSSGVRPAPMDPIEKKFSILSTSINNNSLLDKEVKPSPQDRDELGKILRKPSSAPLADHEKRMLWKYRYFFSKNYGQEDAQTAAVPSQSQRQFLTKFLKCFNWENEQELDHAMKEILPYWSVEKIDMGDALELLSNQFNPYNLTAALRRRLVDTKGASGREINTSEEQKIEKIFNYAMRLREFAVDRLKIASADELLLYLLQLVQALKYETLEDGDAPLAKAPLAKFLILRSVESGMLGNFFYWYVKVENEDQLNASDTAAHSKVVNGAIYGVVLNKYIEKLRTHCSKRKLPHYKYLKRQIAFIKKLTGLVEKIRTTFKRNEATAKKVQYLREYLADPSNEMLSFPDPFPLPLDPSVIICGCYPEESSVFKSSLAPLKITFKTITNYKDRSLSSHSSQIFGGAKKHKYGKYPLMFKIGDDLRQDQLVIQIINLMDQLLKNENLDLKLTPYKILATSPIAGLIQFVENETLDAVLTATYDSTGTNTNSQTNTPANGILRYLQLHSRKLHHEEPESQSVLGKKKNSIPSQEQEHAISSDLGVSPVVMDNYVKSCAGYCVITYLLGVGDRHLDNLLLSPNGKFWHADFGYILGRDPKPFPPLMKLPIQVVDGMGGMTHENFNIFKNYCFITYTTLRRNSNLILNLFQLMLNANIPDIQIDPKRAVEKVQEKFALEMTEEMAILHFQNLIIDSVNAFLPVVIDALHSLAQYWRA
ncbi:hypothetical_protein [Candidozyma auris]|uniref:phosphatidylinositol 3-kinase VPS34 n=1 Tax=Candidozyma auris TaxID=498019 RepID=UPI000D290C6F|nr:phosphatidylinositol 3-kinase VPS34 [[Candida] auris]QEO21452.1 hypothetical_protein [[Candida] auris]GBL48045.1 putative phosphatidylinositol kinase [[Candida] auris]